MEEFTGAAAALSTYGLYFIVAVLGGVVARLYKRQTDLEKEFRDTLSKCSAELSKANAELKDLVDETKEVINKNTQALERLSYNDLRGVK